MPKRILAKFRPTPSMAVALFGVAIALGSSGYAANGGNFLLGLFNSATQLTALVANFNGSALQVANTSTAASAVPLQLTAAAGHPPMKINTAVKVTNLNADYVDGIDAATQLTRVKRIPFTLAAGASTAPIVLPANVPVHVMGTDGVCVGGATIFSKNGQVAWAGADSCGGNASTPDGIVSDVGHFIFYIDATGGVGCPCGLLVEVAASGAIRVHAAANVSYSGEITLVW